MAFLRNLLATIVGLFLFSIIGFLILVGIFASASAEEVPSVKENAILYFPMTGVLQERAVEDPFLEAFGNSPKVHSHLDILNAIWYAKDDDRIKGIYLKPQFLSAGFAQLQEIREALLDFKTSGKFIYAYGEYISESDYYVVSVADSLYLNPTGALEFNGLSANVVFYKGLFEKLDIEPEIFRVGEFKSAVEPYMRKDMSEENRLQYSELLNSVYNTYLTNLAPSLGKSKERLAEISGQMLLNLPADAANLKMVHKIGYEDELKAVMYDKVGISDSKDLPLMKIGKYAKAIEVEKDYSTNKVAVIVAEGNIVMSGNEGIVGKKYADEIKKARENDAIKAIVLRINSGGGSLTASDMIWRELMLTKNKKPIIASMSTVAASGGYYIAMPADTILAEPNTITGSIGIFGLWVNLSKFMENKIGITNDVVKTGEYADLLNPLEPLSDGERQKIQAGVDHGYEIFTSKAAAARNMSMDQLKKIAGGRVWSGEQALENGLIDALGGIDLAVELAAKAAGISDDFKVRYYPEQKPFFEEVLNKMSEQAMLRIVGIDTDPLVEKVKQLHNLQGIQAIMPGDLTIK